MTTELEHAVAIQHAWKPGPVLRAAVELVKAGLAELDKGRGHFGCDNVREEYQYEGQGICGVATRMLLQADIIKPSQYHNPSIGVIHGRRASLRESGHGRRVDLYELVNRGLAEAFVMKHEPAYKAVQLDWVELSRQGKLQEGKVV